MQAWLVAVSRRCHPWLWGMLRGFRVLGGPGRRAFLQVDEQGSEIGRVEAADAAGLAERAGADAGELLAGLGPQLRHGGVVQVGWHGHVLQAAEPLDLVRLAV